MQVYIDQLRSRDENSRINAARRLSEISNISQDAKNALYQAMKWDHFRTVKVNAAKALIVHQCHQSEAKEIIVEAKNFNNAIVQQAANNVWQSLVASGFFSVASPVRSQAAKSYNIIELLTGMLKKPKFFGIEININVSEKWTIVVALIVLGIILIGLPCASILTGPTAIASAVFGGLAIGGAFTVPLIIDGNSSLANLHQKIADKERDLADLRRRSEELQVRLRTLEIQLTVATRNNHQLQQSLTDFRNQSNSDRTRIDELEIDLQNERRLRDALAQAQAENGNEINVDALVINSNGR